MENELNVLRVENQRLKEVIAKLQIEMLNSLGRVKSVMTEIEEIRSLLMEGGINTQ